ncbi:MAG: hypothetical protein K8F30_07220 [Taibaiella sp.]|nr:hypothetical protein [Taibaiella sp.]MCX9078087.1 hypothetical protein [Candidatus Methanoperedens sp.]
MNLTEHKNAFAVQVGNVIVQLNYPSNDLALFVILGEAIASIQAFELSVASFLARIDTTSLKTEDATSYETLIDKTLGALIRLFRQFIVDDNLANSLEEVRKERNYIVHNILRHYKWPLMSDQQYLEAIQEIKGIIEHIHQTKIAMTKYVANSDFLDNMLIIYYNPESNEIEIISKIRGSGKVK